MEKRTKESSKRINSLILLIAFTAIMLIVSTYAWFTSQRDITLSNLRGTVEVAENMEISLDAKTWTQEINFANANPDGDSGAEAWFNWAQASRDGAGAGTTAAAVLPDTLLPVSGIGETGEKIMPLYSGDATSKKVTGITQCVEEAASGYFAYDIYIKNTKDKNALVQEDVLQLNLNSAVHVLHEEIVKHIDANTTRTYMGNSDSGLQNTVRVALALYEDTVSSTSDQKDIILATRESKISKIAIWEPNAYYHIPYVVDNISKLRVNGNAALPDISETDSYVSTYAINKDILKTGTDDAKQNITNVYDISSPGTSEQKTFATKKLSANDYRVKPLESNLDDATPLDITDNTGADFKIKANAVSRIRVYVWLEGQDVDCINDASQGGGIEIDLGLTKDDEIGDVLGDPKYIISTP